MGEDVSVGVLVEVGVGVRVWVDVDVGVKVGVRVTVGVGVLVDVGVMLGVWVGVGVLVSVGRGGLVGACAVSVGIITAAVAVRSIVALARAIEVACVARERLLEIKLHETAKVNTAVPNMSNARETPRNSLARPKKRGFFG